MTNKTTITQPKKSEVAKQKHRDEKGRFVKRGESVYCVSTYPKGKGYPSKNCIKYFEYMIRKNRERERL